MTDQNSPEEMQEQIAAEELGVNPEEIQLPPNIRKGIILFELDDGNFGFQPMGPQVTLLDAYGLCARVMAGVQADMAAAKVIEMNRAALQQARQAQQKRPNIIVPGRK